jgi:hypothetical protein
MQDLGCKGICCQIYHKRKGKLMVRISQIFPMDTLR